MTGPYSRYSFIHAQNKFITVLILVFSAFGGILFGYDCGIISGLQGMQDWLRTFGHPTDDGYALSSGMQSLVVSILSVGTIFGSFASAPIADLLGRKLGIAFSAILFSVGIAMQVASTAIPLFVLGRFIAGIGVGLTSCLIPLYQSECAPKQIRGAVVSAYLFFITVGFLLSSVVNNATKDIDNHGAYRIPISLQFAWAAILAIGMMFLPESPSYYIKKAKFNAAKRSIASLSGLPLEHQDVETEFNEIKKNLEQRRAEGASSSYRACFQKSKNKIALRTWTGIGIQACQMIAGVNFISQYGTQFFQNTHITDPFTVVVLMQTVVLIMSVFGSWAIERFGRRPLLLIGFIGTSVCSYIVAITSVAVSNNNMAGAKMIVSFTFLYMAFWAACLGNTAWVVPGEIFPLEVRAKAMSLSSASNWFWGFVIGLVSPFIVNTGPGSLGLGTKVFFIWGTTCIIGVAFTYFCVPETQGLSLEQIDMMYENSTPLNSMKYRATLKNQTHASPKAFITLSLEKDSPEPMT